MMIAGQHCRQNKTNTRTSTGGEVEQQDEGHARHGGILLQGDTAPGGATVRPQVFPPVIVAAIGYRNGRKATGATVASARAWDLSVHAKHLFVVARGCGVN